MQLQNGADLTPARPPVVRCGEGEMLYNSIEGRGCHGACGHILVAVADEFKFILEVGVEGNEMGGASNWGAVWR